MESEIRHLLLDTSILGVCSGSHFSRGHYYTRISWSSGSHVQCTIQLASDLGGNQWLQYGKACREWAAAKDVRLGGNLNLPIFCHCLVMQQRASLQPQELSKSSNSPYTRSSGCQMWNFEEACTRRGCRFLRNYYYCRGPHKAPIAQQE